MVRRVGTRLSGRWGGVGGSSRRAVVVSAHSAIASFSLCRSWYDDKTSILSRSLYSFYLQNSTREDARLYGASISSGNITFQRGNMHQPGGGLKMEILNSLEDLK